MSTKIIRSLFENRLKTWAAARSPVLRISYEDDFFTPAAKETYLRAFTLPAKTGSDDLEGGHRIYTGVWQVSIVKPAGGGIGAASGIADELAALFPQNLELTSGAFTVAVREPMGTGPLIVDANISTLPVSCFYRADTP